MEGYVIANFESKNIKGGVFDVTTFQGEHCDEYLVKDSESGERRLYRKGVLELSWREANGRKIGDFTMFDKGKSLGKENWSVLLNDKERRYIENRKKEVRLIIRKGEHNHMVYRGGFDNEQSMKRDGEGYAYDEESGRVLIHGVWRDDKLFQIYQEFESEHDMIEYDVIQGVENVSVLNRRPVYEGGYTYRDLTDEYVRHGVGNKIDVESGVAYSECTWSNGAVMNSAELFGGWYVKGRADDAAIQNAKVWTVERGYDVEWESLGKNIYEIDIPSCCCNKSKVKVLDLSELSILRRIKIGSDCFDNVDEVRIVGLNKLERIDIGKNCFTKQKDTYEVTYNPNRRFVLKNCPRVHIVRIDRYSFSDYSVCQIEGVNGLEAIEMGALGEYSSNFYHASLELKSIHIHSE